MGALLGVCVTLASAACADGPTGLDRAGIEAAPVQSAAKAGGGGTMQVVCSISYAAHEGPHAYLYDRITVKLPAASRALDGSTRQYRFRNHAGTKVVGAANCTIPATKLAAAHMDRFFGVKERGGRRMQQNEGGASLMSDEHTLPTLEVKACQHGGTYPLCDPEPIDWDGLHNPPEQQVCHTDCGGGGSSGGPTPEPPAEEEEEPCQTEDPVLNSTRVQTGFAQLWGASQAGGPHESRREAAGFIVKNADGSFSFQHLSSTAGIISDPCQVRVTNVVVPPNVVGWVHTHPYGRGDIMEACGRRTYVRGASEDDVSTVRQLTTLKEREIKGYILDRDGIMTYSASTRKNRYDEFTRRCGY